MYFNITDSKMYHAALYVRLSREDEREGSSQSIINQEAMLNHFSQKQNIAVYHTYVDDGFSGTDFDRPAFKQMIRDIEAHKINMVITKDLSRLGRDYIMTGYYVERYFPEHEVRYISLLDGIDTAVESTNNDILPFRAIMNDLYAKDISKKIRSIKHNKQKQGIFIGGKTLYGYQFSPDTRSKLAVDEEAAPIVRRIFSMALSGTSCRQIAATLNEEQVPSPSVYAQLNTGRKGPYHGLWSSERISAMLQNETYIGNLVQGRMASISYKTQKSVKLPRHQWTVVKSTHAPIIDRETFCKVGQLIRSRQRPKQHRYDYLLKGLIFCHECGYPLGVINCPRSDQNENLNFICRTYQRFSKSRVCTSHYRSVNSVTDEVLRKVQAVCSAYLERFSPRFASQRNGDDLMDTEESKARFLEIRLHTLSARLDQMYADRLSGILAPEDFQEAYLNLKISRDHLTQELQSLKADRQHFTSAELKPGDLAEKFLLDRHCDRDLLQGLVKRIELSEDDDLFIQFVSEDMNQIYSRQENARPLKTAKLC